MPYEPKMIIVRCT